MDLLKIAFDASRGIGDAHYNQQLREGNRDANLGMNHFFLCITQYSLLENTFSKVNEIVQNLSLAKISSNTFSLTTPIAIFIPLSLTFLKKFINFTNYPTIHTGIGTLDKSIFPNLILVTNLVAAVAYIVFKNPIYGSVNLLFLLLHLVDEKGWMNTDFIQKNWVLTGVLEMATISKALDALIIRHSLNPYYLWILADKTYQAARYITKPTPIKVSPITLCEYESKYSEAIQISYRLHEYHLVKNPSDNRPLEDLTHQFDRYVSSLTQYLKQDLSIHNLQLLHKFRNEEKWIQDYNNNPVDYLKHGIHSFVHAIKVTNNLEFKNKSLGIIRYILNLPYDEQNDEQNDEQIDRFADLAITGHYCPERIYSDVNLLYDTYVDTLESRGLSTKVINLLHNERVQILDQFLAEINEAKAFLGSRVTLISNTNESPPLRQRLSNLYLQLLSSLVPPMDDIHFANSMKHILCPYLYVHHKSIDTLTEIVTKTLSWSLVNWFYQKTGYIKLVKSMFVHHYNPAIVFQRISKIIEKEPTISNVEIEQWFIEQYMCDYPEASRNTAEEWLRQQVYTFDNEYTPTIKAFYMLFFLINQGVLQVEDNPNFDKNPQEAIEVINTLFLIDSLQEMTVD